MQNQQQVKIDDDFLAGLGLGDLSEEDKQAFVLHLQEELEMRVGEILADRLTDEQLDEFGEIVESDNPEAAGTWLQENAPGYEQVVLDELEKLRQEIIQNNQAFAEGTPPPQEDDNQQAA